MWLLKLFLGLILLPYLAVLAALYLGQTRIVFPAGGAAGGGPLPQDAERISFTTPDGDRLSGVHFRAPAGGGDRPLILGFGGNAWNGDDVALTLAALYPGHEIVAFHYRGYRPSEGAPSAAALLSDAPLVHDEVARRFEPERIVAVGFSIGTAVAARLARDRRLAGLILVTPFDSLTAVAAGHYQWIPVRFLFRHDLPAARDLAGSDVRTAIIAAGADTLIRPARTDALRSVIRPPVFDRTITGAGHNDIYRHPEFASIMREALTRVTQRPVGVTPHPKTSHR